MIGKLALETQTDILPLYIDGAYQAMPKGAAFPKQRGITIHIGPPLQYKDFARLTDGMKTNQAARHISQLTRTAVERLGQGSCLDLSRIAGPEVQEVTVKVLSPTELVAKAFAVLETKYDPQRIERPICWYFSLGAKDGPRWTVQVDKERCLVRPGRPQNGAADCVVKTSTALFTRLVTDKTYTPSPAEFMSGEIKTNDLSLLIEFGQVFQLSEDQL